MSNETCTDRAGRLWRSEQRQRQDRRNYETAKLIAQSARAGGPGAGNSIAALEAFYKNELVCDVGRAWDILRDTHRAMGRDTSLQVRNEMKRWVGDIIRGVRPILADELRVAVGAQANLIPWQMFETANELAERYDPLIDNYLDQVVNQPPSGAGVVINAQTIGAVLTGNNATVHIKQNTQAIAQLRDALKQIQTTIAQEKSLDESRKKELQEIAKDASAELEKAEPNETKLLTFYTVLAQAIQTIPAAKPTYDIVKAILSGWGINLP